MIIYNHPGGFIMSDKLKSKRTNLPTIEIASKDVGSKYEYLGQGHEGIVYRFDSQTAIKIFKPFDNRYYQKLKFQKVKVFSQFTDPSFTFPKGLVEFETHTKEGYYKNLVDVHSKYPTFDALSDYPNCHKKLDIILSGDSAIKRAHSTGLVLGDIKKENLLIDRDLNPVFVDCDNYAGLGFGFDLLPYRIRRLTEIHGKDFSVQDSDKFLYAVKALHIIIGYPISRMPKEFYYELVMKLNVSLAVKNGLLEIFSDMRNKPYVGDIIKEINPEEKILSLENASKLGLHRK